MIEDEFRGTPEEHREWVYRIRMSLKVWRRIAIFMTAINFLHLVLAIARIFM